MFEQRFRPLAMAALAGLLGVCASALADAPVSISNSGKNVVLANGIVSVSINVSGAGIAAAKYGSHEMVSNSGRHQEVYFSRDGGDTYERPDHCIGSVTAQSPELIDFSCKHMYSPRQGDKAPWDVDVHFVVRRGVSGVYCYTINSHPANYPELGVGEWRMVWSPPETRNDYLDTIFIDRARHWQIPAPGDTSEPVNGPKEVTKFTSGSWAGRLDCKYMYAASYWQIGTWGFASTEKHLGGFVVLPSKEFFNDGPNKQDLTAAIGTTLLHLNMNHYDGTSFKIPAGKEWTKFYGPWLLYFNNKSTAEDCWHDAQDRVKTEAAQWPYDWVKNPLYPGKSQRGSVTGQIVLSDALKPKLTAAEAWVGLSPPLDTPTDEFHGGDFQFEATGYQFWTKADAQGKFDLTNVRPGKYTLYAYTGGVVGQCEKTGVEVKAGQTVSLNQIIWHVKHPGRQIAWEIGVPDRTTTEFAHGKDYYTPLLYQQLETEIPEPLDFTIGKSDSAKDWYYAQYHHGNGGNDRGSPSHWRIHFNLASAPSGPSTLTLAFAGADRGRIGVEANGHRIGEVTPPVQGGNILIREGAHGKYSYSYVTIPTGDLHAGENTITLMQESQGFVMYDFLNLETP